MHFECIFGYGRLFEKNICLIQSVYLSRGVFSDVSVKSVKYWNERVNLVQHHIKTLHDMEQHNTIE